MASKKSNKQQKFQEAVDQARQPVEPGMQEPLEVREGPEMPRKGKRRNNADNPFVRKNG